MKATGSDTPEAPLQGQLDIDAHVLRQLGDQLISDPEQAIFELVKNTYDADAEWARVRIDSNYENADTSLGIVTVEDNGSGMTLDAIRDGWLFISASPKRAMKEQGRLTPRFRRTPLGDKGLGRLATMRLGDIVEIRTFTSAKASGYRVVLDWRNYKSGVALSRVPVPIEQLPPSGKQGTTVEIRGLRDLPYWRHQRRAESLSKKMAGLITPFERFSNFAANITVEGQHVELHSIESRTREAATCLAEFSWSKSGLSLVVRMKHRLFHAAGKDVEYQDYLVEDGGKAFSEYLLKQKGAAALGLGPGKGAWLFEGSLEWSKSEVLEYNTTIISDPGPLRGEILTLEFDAPLKEGAGSPFSDLRAYIKSNPGIGVYRDGFGVRMPEDWVGLGRSWSSGKSWYGLKPPSTIGFLALSARDNAGLAEKSDREGFVDNPSYRGFTAVVQRVVKGIDDLLSYVRRKFGEYVEEQKAAQALLPSAWKPVDAVSRVRDLARVSETRQKKISAYGKAAEAASSRGRELVAAITSRVPTSTAKRDVERLSAELTGILTDAQKRASELEQWANEVRDLSSVAEAIHERFEQLQGQIAEVYDFVGIGLTAQTLAHDVFSILDDLWARSQKAVRIAKASGSVEMVAYVEAVKATVNSLRKQVAVLDSMSRAARETRQTIKVGDFVRDFFDLRSERMAAERIGPRLTIANDMVVRMNRGRLLQVLDNLWRNSEYWLARTNGERFFDVSLDRPFMVVSDSGPGIKSSLEGSLFDLFVSGKPRGEASGLGLFIVRQLLENEGCDIQLDSSRNQAGRRNSFKIDLSGALHG